MEESKMTAYERGYQDGLAQAEANALYWPSLISEHAPVARWWQLGYKGMIDGHKTAAKLIALSIRNLRTAD